MNISSQALLVAEGLAGDGIEVLRDQADVLADQYRYLSEASSHYADAALERARLADELGMQDKGFLQDFWDTQAFQFREWSDKFAAQADDVFGELDLNLSNQTSDLIKKSLAAAGGTLIDGYQVLDSLLSEDYYGAAGNVGGVLVGVGLMMGVAALATVGAPAVVVGMAAAGSFAVGVFVDEWIADGLRYILDDDETSEPTPQPPVPTPQPTEPTIPNEPLLIRISDGVELWLNPDGSVTSFDPAQIDTLSGNPEPFHEGTGEMLSDGTVVITLPDGSKVTPDGQPYVSPPGGDGDGDGDGAGDGAGDGSGDGSGDGAGDGAGGGSGGSGGGAGAGRCWQWWLGSCYRA